MEPVSSEVPLLKIASPKQSPKPPHVMAPVAPQPLGVLHLGKVSREACTEVDAVRIIVPRAAITRSGRAGPAEGRGESGQQEREQGSPPLPPVEDWRGQLEKLQNSERRLLQDKEGLSNQLRVQTEVRNQRWLCVSGLFLLNSLTFLHVVSQVNRELKKLLVASVGDDLEYQFERSARERNQLILENEALGRSLAHTAEQLERMSIQCDVWRSKFLASR